MKFYQLFLTVTFLTVSSVSLANNLTGTYQCKGHDPVLQKDYKVKATITQNEDIYYVTWDTDDGRKFNGMGLLEKNVLALMFQQTSQPTESSGMGMQLYIPQGKKLYGRWLFSNSAQVGTEVCEKENVKQ